MLTKLRTLRAPKPLFAPTASRVQHNTTDDEPIAILR